MDTTAELLEELESRRTFSAFLTNRRSDETDDSGRQLGGSMGDSLEKDHQLMGRKNRKSRNGPHRTGSSDSMGGLAEFIQRDRAVYKQRTWLARIAKQLRQDQLASEVSIASSPYPTPITVSVGGGGKKKKRHGRKAAPSALGRMTPGSTLLSIGESCEAKTAQAVKPLGSGAVDVKAWPAFRQYKSIVATSAATRVPKFKPEPVILRPGKKPSGLPPTLASILASSRVMTASPQLKPSMNAGRVPMDPLFPLHLVRLAVIDGEEDRACAILEDAFGLCHPRSQRDSPPRTPKLKASLLSKPKFWPLLLRIWLRAVDRGMDSLLLMLWAAGIPASPLAPIAFSAAKRPPPPTSAPKFYTLAGLTSSVSILSSGSGTVAASNNWLQRNYREWMVDRFPSFLLAAIAFGRTKLVQAMIEGARKTTYALVNSAGWLGFTPLLAATSGRGHLHLTKALLEAGADPIIGISYYYFLLARRKLTAGRKPKKRLSTNISVIEEKIQWAKEIPLLPIEVAAASHNFELVLMLLGRSLVPMRLGLLVQSDLDISVRLLKAGAVCREIDAFGNTAMHRAAAKGRLDLIALYIHYGCPIDAANVHGCTALHEAAAHGQKSVLRYLIQAGADCSVQNQQGLTALEVARRHGQASEDLADYFSSIKPRPATPSSKMQEDMEALIQQVDSYNLRSDLDLYGAAKNVAQQRPQRPEPTQQQRKGRFLIEKIINPKQWWS